MTIYLHTRVRTTPLAWSSVATTLAARFAEGGARDGETLYGIWRSQIGRPRDELTVMTTWPDGGDAAAALAQRLAGIDGVHQQSSVVLVPTLRPLDPTPPRRQGNYAFRWFTTPQANWSEFLDLCAGAWPGFESAYDSQVIGLWRATRLPGAQETSVRSLLMTRRPDLAMWERSKIPQGGAEAEVRRKLSRRYDLCTDTVVFTTTLLTASDHADTARWT
ncbi:MAG: hypothetical protein R3D31_16135 [Hyphomicrobiaceae bacterium]